MPSSDGMPSEDIKFFSYMEPAYDFLFQVDSIDAWPRHIDLNSTLVHVEDLTNASFLNSPQWNAGRKFTVITSCFYVVSTCLMLFSAAGCIGDQLRVDHGDDFHFSTRQLLVQNDQHGFDRRGPSLALQLSPGQWTGT